MLGSWQKTGVGIETQLGDFTTDTRVLVVAAMAVLVATAAVGALWILLRLVTLITNIAYHGRLTLEALPLTGSLPLVSILIPVAAVGAWDFWSNILQPRRKDAYTAVPWHIMAMATALLLCGGSLVCALSASGILSLVLSGCGALALAPGGWMGGTLVYEFGIGGDLNPSS
jgi:hypothetical protein